jgi:pyrroloquinoline quinone biosynthesis protein B
MSSNFVKSLTYFVFGILILVYSGNSQSLEAPFVVVLGIAQDGGYPQPGCRRTCCQRAWNDSQQKRHISCLAIVDPESKKRWLIDATPDFREQLHQLNKIFPVNLSPGLSGILLTHGHIGHYSGLVHLGREVIGAASIPLYTMPKMADFLRQNGPWNLLIELNNIELIEIENKGKIQLNTRIIVTPIEVPHRGEYTETVGFIISGPQKNILFIPDIDKWSLWNEAVESYIKEVDLAYLDATFYDSSELPGRDMSEIPHPFIVESMNRFESLTPENKSKIRFIHLNHTNPALNSSSDAHSHIVMNGFCLAKEGEKFDL